MGDLHAMEICISRAPDWHAESALKGLSVEGIKTLTLVCRSLKDMQAISSVLKELDPSRSYGRRLRWAILEDYFTEK